MVGRAHRRGVPGTHRRAVRAQTFKRTRDRHRVGAACALDGRCQHLQHQVHARMHVVVLRLRKALAEGGVESLRLHTTHVRLPLRHRQHAADTGFTDRRRRAQRIAIEGVELGVAPHLAQCAHQQRQVIAPVGCQHRLRAAGLDLGGIGQEVAHAAQRVQLFADDLHVGPFGVDHQPRLLHHLLAKAVVLRDEVHALHAAVIAQDIGQCRQPHVGMGIETKVPEAAAFVGELRVHRRVVEEERSPLRFTLVVLVQCIHQRSRCGRAVALQHEADALVQRAAQQAHRLFGVAFAVHAQNGQRPLDAGRTTHPHAATLVDAFSGQQEVAKHRFARICKRPREAFDERQPDRLGRCLRGSPAGRKGQRQGQQSASIESHRKVSFLKKTKPSTSARHGCCGRAAPANRL